MGRRFVDAIWIRQRMQAKDDRVNAALQAKYPVRRQRDETCPTCARYQPGEMYPPHDASRRCELGQRNHCTCDVCF